MSLRAEWRNCAPVRDSEILDIDRMEDDLAPIAPNCARIRELISTVEMCHHKAERWVRNIIEAIGAGQTTKGLGARSPDQPHAVEHVWQNACDALAAWCAGCPSISVDLSVDTVPASHMLARLGERSPLKEWQVQRVIERIRSFVRWPRSADDISTHYLWMLEYGGGIESAPQSECPKYYREHLDDWRQTVETRIRDTNDGTPAELSLAVAIDLLMPCHWNFVRNLEIVLGAIGGDLNPASPVAACARNIKLSPIRDRMAAVCRTLRVFWQNGRPDGEADGELLGLLGKPSREKKWLAASLDKTIRLQLGL